MDDGKLIARLEALVPPDRGLARERAIENVPLRLASAAETANEVAFRLRLRSRGSRAARLAAVGLAACLALACIGAFTSPGRAMTSWVGDRLGFGQPGGHPSLRQLRAGWTHGTSAEGQPAYVLAVGPVPGEGKANDGGRYELITYWPRQPRHSLGGGRWELGKPCFELDLTQARSSYGGFCGVLPEGPDLFVSGVAGNSAPGDELFFVSGQTSDAVAAVQAELNGNPIPIELVPIPAKYVQRFHLGRTFKFFIGFLEGKLRGGMITLTALDASGRVLARRRLEAPNVVAAQRANCKWAHEVLRKEEISRKNAFRNLRASCAGLR